MSRQVSAWLVRQDISTALQENPDGPNVLRRYLLLTAKLQSAMANFTFKAPLTLHFRVKNCCLCPKNVIKWPETMLNSLGIVLYLSLNKESDELLVPK